MNGVSHMLVFAVAGVLTAVSFLWGIISSTAPDYNSFAAMLAIIGGIAMGLLWFQFFRLHCWSLLVLVLLVPRFCCRRLSRAFQSTLLTLA